MKRRKILGAMGIMGLPSLGKASSLYGTPVSVSGKVDQSNQPLRLLLTSINVPNAILPLMTQFGTVWEQVLGNETQKELFKRDPGGFLLENGIPRSVLDARDQEVVLLKALTDDEVMKSALSGDYLDFLTRLKELGVSSQTAKSGMKKQVLSILRDNLADIKQSIDPIRRNLNIAGASTPYAKSQELTYLYSQLAPSIEQVAVAAVPVAIAAIAVVYISVGAIVTVGILAGVYASIAVASAITVGNEDLCAELDNSRYTMFAGPASAPQVGRTERQRKIQHAIAQRELVGKRMMVLSPERLMEAQQAVRLGKLLNQGKFILEANRQLIKDEVGIFLEAAEEVGLLKIPSNSRAEVLATLQTIALRASALD